jgi:DNA excision repair protein ERCC-6
VADLHCAVRSGKLQVLVRVLAAWRSEGHKVLLFTQTQQMLDIIEKHVVDQGYSYHRMDGNTPIASRGRLMDDFNHNPTRSVWRQDGSLLWS